MPKTFLMLLAKGFWLATLDPGGGIADLQYVADMVVEPAGPPDHY